MIEGWVNQRYPQYTGWEPNSWSLDHKSDTLTTTPPSRPNFDAVCGLEKRICAGSSSIVSNSNSSQEHTTSAVMYIFGPIPYRPQTTSATKHDHIDHKVGFVVWCFYLYPSCSGGSFRTFMRKRKCIKIRWRGGRLKMWDMKVQDRKIRHEPVIGKLWIVECWMSKPESKPADLTVE